jgi:hypothetical protein
VIAALLLAAAVPAAQPTLSADTEDRWIPFDLTPGNQIRFTMELDGRPVTAILDTGVSMSVLAQRYAEANRLSVAAEGRAQAIGGTVDVGTVATTRLAIGGLERRGGTLAVAALPAAATGSATAVDLLVGRDLTGAFGLDIDYAQRRFRFLKSGRMPFAGTTAPLAIAPERQVYVSQVTLGGARLQPMIVDTGDGSAVTLGAPGWRAARPPAGPVTTTVAFGLKGPVVSEVAIVPNLVVGNMVAHNVEVRIEPAGGFSDTLGVAGRIGSGFLQRYRVLLDPGAGHMLLSPGPDADRPPLRSTSGLLLGLATDRLRVLHVMRASPAADAGWREGETVCAVDGAAITPAYAASPLAQWTTGAPGRTVSFRMCDGTARTLVLRAFY